MGTLLTVLVQSIGVHNNIVVVIYTGRAGIIARLFCLQKSTSVRAFLSSDWKVIRTPTTEDDRQCPVSGDTIAEVTRDEKIRWIVTQRGLVTSRPTIEVIGVIILLGSGTTDRRP